LDRGLNSIERELQGDTVHPFVELTTLVSSPNTTSRREIKPNGMPARIGVFPLAANPLHWGHIIRALDCVASLHLDTIVSLVHGTIDYKNIPVNENVPPALRHRIVCDTRQVFHPLLRYTDVALGSNKFGEETLHDLRRLNRDLRAEWVCISGTDNEDRLKFILGQLSRHERDNAGISPNHTISLAIVVLDDERKHLPSDDCRKVFQEERVSWDTTVLIASERTPVATRLNSTDYRNTGDLGYLPASIHKAVSEHCLNAIPLPTRR
jgi:hypothetical protein